jgi:ubiquilin
MKINIQHLKNKFALEIEDLNITIEELKRRVEESMSESVRIPATEQTLIFETDKLEDSKKLSDYVKEDAGEIKMFVIRRQRNPNPISRPPQAQQPSESPRVTAQPAQGAPPYGGYQQFHSPHGGYGQPPYGGYGGQPGYGQMPFGGYGSPQPGYGQMPYGGYGSPQNFGSPFPFGGQNSEVPNAMLDQMEQMINNPVLLDQALSMYGGQNMTPEQKEEAKKMLVENLKMFKNNPAFLNQVLNSDVMRRNIDRMGMGQPMMPPTSFPPAPNFGQYADSSVPVIPCQHGYYPPSYASGRPEAPNYEQVYAKQLSQLQEMGFSDKAKNIEALIKGGGDIDKALDILYQDKK